MSSREEFEAWYLEKWGHTEDHHETLFERDPDDEYGYYRLGVRMAHQAWQAATKAMEAKCDALAAENAALKASEREFDKMCAEEFGPDWVSEFTETPATDSFLAEVRAQGVERLANAWYAIANETDPGISISDSSRLKYRQRADDAADFANDIRQEAAQ